MSMQDLNRSSPSHGCFHYGYWRDKTSEFADVRFQEAAATLALLSLPEFDAARDEGRLPGREALYRGFSAGLGFWASSQYPEGCFDEWYKGERGFAATEFTSIAFGLAAYFLDDRLDSDDRRLLTATLRRACEWLATRHDRIKSNHEAAAAAALALGWKLTGEARFLSAAREKIDDLLARQKPEGWFPEIGGMDLGYCSVLLDYVMIYVLVSGDDQPVDAMDRLFKFMLPHIHPDGTTSAEAGLCLNAYVSRLGSGLLSHYSDGAGALVSTYSTSSPGRGGMTPYLGDDLRLARWSYLPVVTALLKDRFRRSAPDDGLIGSYTPGWTVCRDAAVFAYHSGATHIFFAPCGGGVLRLYVGNRLEFEDMGATVNTRTGRWVNLGYDPGRRVEAMDDGYRVYVNMGRPAFFFPGFLSRLVLRIGSWNARTSKLLRSLIDFYRLRNRTAVNQSAAPMARGRTAYVFRRSVAVTNGAVEIIDEIESADEPLSIDQVSPDFTAFGGTSVHEVEAGQSPRVVRIRKRIGSGLSEMSAPQGHRSVQQSRTTSMLGSRGYP